MKKVININGEKGFSLIELMVGLAILGIVILALTAVVNTTFRANQTVLTDINQIKQARKAIKYIMDEIHYCPEPQNIELLDNPLRISYSAATFNNNGTVTSSTNVLTYKGGVLTLTRNGGAPTVIADRNTLRTFTITQVTNSNRTVTYYYRFDMRFSYNPNAPSKDLIVTENVKPFTYR